MNLFDACVHKYVVRTLFLKPKQLYVDTQGTNIGII